MIWSAKMTRISLCSMLNFNRKRQSGMKSRKRLSVITSSNWKLKIKSLKQTLRRRPRRFNSKLNKSKT